MEKTNYKIQLYLKRIDELYSLFKDWSKEEELLVHSKEVDIDEVREKKYKAPMLIISTKSKEKLAEIVPIGFNILAGEGRVDIKGRFDIENIIYLLKEGPFIRFKESVLKEGKKTFESQFSEKHLFKGVDKDDWYWIESRLGRAKRLDKELFLDILTAVSDYEFAN